jgi:hypothetical protein
MMRNVVVLPQPDGPSSASISPPSIVCVIGRSAWTEPKLLLIPSSCSGTPRVIVRCSEIANGSSIEAPANPGAGEACMARITVISLRHLPRSQPQ